MEDLERIDGTGLAIKVLSLKEEHASAFPWTPATGERTGHFAILALLFFAAGGADDIELGA